MSGKNTKRKITVITGTRAEYGIFYPVLKAIQEHPKLQLSLIATGMHLSQNHNYTAQEIEDDGFLIDAKVDILFQNNTGAAMAKSVGLGILGMAQALETIKPDIILILGDRGEMLAAAVAGAYMNIPVAHLHGGEVSGNIDEPVRHAITKLAHIHFPATEESALRIRRLGEEPERIFVVGAAGLDNILNEELYSPEYVANNLGLDLEKQILLVVQHPVTTETNDAEIQMRETMEALVELGKQTVLVYPNSDAGSYTMIRIIKEYEHLPFLHTFVNIPHRMYLSLMKVASVMIGNSSGGIIEAPSFRLPVINIGSRQNGRQRANNVIDVDYKREEIKEAVFKALGKEFQQQVATCLNPYGEGNTGPKAAQILADIKLDPRLLQKQITF